jgi:photosystem II stability/assembly factor-like uncharacterized protein
MRQLPLTGFTRAAALLPLALFVTLAPALAQTKRGEPQAVEGVLPSEWVDALPWRSIGPANMGGRITDMAVDPGDRCRYWVATASGGLLYTENNGVSYDHQFSSQAVSSIGAVAVSPSNTDVVWVGTGECNPRNSVSFGNGVYKSADGGKTWEHMGLPNSFQISTIVVHPEDENIVYVGALGRLWGPNDERGLFATRDGGESWEKLFYVDEDTGVIEIKLKPDDPNTLLVATYDLRRDIYDSNDPAQKWGDGSALWRTTDGGKTFERLTEEGRDNGLPTVELGRIGVDFCKSQPEVVLAVIETELITQEPEDVAYAGIRGEDAEIGARLTDITEKGPAEAAGLQKEDIVLRVDDQPVLTYSGLTDLLRLRRAGEVARLEVFRAGEVKTIEITFATKPPREGDATDDLGYPRTGPLSGGLGGQRENQQQFQAPNGHQYGGIYKSTDGGVSWARINSLNPRPMYYSEIRVDPSDPSRVYVLGTSLYRSSDGGETFSADGLGRQGVHVDCHAMWIDPEDGRHIMLGNDGGLYVTWDRMELWDHHNHVALGQFYNVAADATLDYKVYGGLQDNGSWGGPSRVRDGRGPVNTDWIRIGGGDGFVCRVDADDPNLVYYESQGGAMGRRHLVTGESGSVRPRRERDLNYRWNWNTPFLLSRHNTRIHYSAGNYVFRSLDRGNGQRRISPKITTTDRGSAVALHESPLDEGLLYVGTDDGGLWKTTDGGREWVDLWELNAGLAAVAKAKPAALDAAQERVDDPVSGSWRAKAAGEGIEGEGEGQFTLELVLGEGGKVTGSMEAEIGAGELREGRYDADTKKLRFAFVRDAFRIDFEGTIGDDGGLSGTINAAGGTFSFTFTATREGQPAKGGADATQAEAADSAQDVAADAPPAQAGAQDEAAEEKPAKPAKFLEGTIDQHLPGRRYVSQLVASAHEAERVYATFDGHRSDDDQPWVLVSEDQGLTWTNLRGNLPDSAGPVRCLAEDHANENLLFIGTEFGIYVSLDRGESWTRMNGNLPTVPVHDICLHEASGDLIAATHGRSIWIVDATPLRQMTKEATDAAAHLYKPGPATQWRTMPSAANSGTRRFVGENPPSGAPIYYSLDKKARAVELSIQRLDGQVLRTYSEQSGESGLYRVVWDLRGSASGGQSQQGRRRFRGGPRVSAGTYKAVLTVDGETYEQEFEVRVDPVFPDPAGIAFEDEFEALQELFEEEDASFDDVRDDF